MARWSKEKAWEWYNSKPWIRGCNFMGSDCANRIDQWQEYGFEEKLETAKRIIDELSERNGFKDIGAPDRFDDRETDRFDDYTDLFPG